MQIVVKASEQSEQDPAEIISRNVAETLGVQDRKTVVAKVFPGQTSGHRARLYTVHLPDDLSARDVNRVIEHLSNQEALEYAEIPAAKRPMASRR